LRQASFDDSCFLPDFPGCCSDITHRFSFASPVPLYLRPTLRFFHCGPFQEQRKCPSPIWTIFAFFEMRTPSGIQIPPIWLILSPTPFSRGHFSHLSNRASSSPRLPPPPLRKPASNKGSLRCGIQSSTQRTPSSLCALTHLVWSSLFPGTEPKLRQLTSRARSVRSPPLACGELDLPSPCNASQFGRESEDSGLSLP